MVVDDVETVFIEFGSQNFFRQRQAYGIGNALSQRAGSGFYAVGVAVFGMAGRFAMELSEIFQVINGYIVTSQMQQTV